jgi:FkbM family methyltransferase
MILDVGAASGEWTRECIQIFPDARYLLIDPIEQNSVSFMALQAQYPNVKFWRGAVGSHPGVLPLHIHGDQSSFFKSTEWYGTGGTQNVEIRTLDSFLETDEIQPPEIIKADVQGFEIEVLRGGVNCLKSAQLLLLELSFRHLYENAPLAHEVITFCGNIGFRIYDICSYVQRPRDGELAQSDFLFAKENSPLFQYEGWA